MKSEKQVQIYQAPQGELVFDIDPEAETIWASQAQISALFTTDRTSISRHLRNIFKSGELDEASVCAFFAHTAADGKTYQTKYYNLDAIISVGYRVNSKKATSFRIWATKTLKTYLQDGVAINERRLKQLDQKKLENVEHMMGVVKRLIARQELTGPEATGVLEVISKYTASFKTLKEFDDGHINLQEPPNKIDLKSLNGKKPEKILDQETCEQAIRDLKNSLGQDAGELFGKPRGGSFSASLSSIYQSYAGADLYPTLAAKAAHLLYFIIKDHPFYDGNKRIGSLLFIFYLTLNGIHLTENGETKISDRALTALALLIAESEPKEKPLITSLVRKLLEDQA